MNFRLDRWCGPAGELAGREAGDRALRELKWALSSFETPQPVALDLDGVVGVSDDFLEGFFGALVEDWPESYFGRHPIVIVGAAGQVAMTLRSGFRNHGLAIPISEQSS